MSPRLNIEDYPPEDEELGVIPPPLPKKPSTPWHRNERVLYGLLIASIVILFSYIEIVTERADDSKINRGIATIDRKKEELDRKKEERYKQKQIDKKLAEVAMQQFLARVTARIDGLEITLVEPKRVRDVKLEINARGFKSGYVARKNGLIAGQTIFIPYLQFALKDGKRYDVYSYKLMHLDLVVHDQNGVRISTRYIF